MNGGTGLGKTFLSACIARQVVSMGYSVIYDTAIHVFSCMEKQKFGGGTEEEKRLAERILECDLLILDDLGTEMSTAFVSPALYSIINGRILDGKPTIISTNLSLGELSRRYTAQIASRLMGEYINLLFLGQDIRLLKAQV
jgi:DNA replication protein DnaC